MRTKHIIAPDKFFRLGCLYCIDNIECPNVVQSFLWNIGRRTIGQCNCKIVLYSIGNMISPFLFKGN